MGGVYLPDTFKLRLGAANAATTDTATARSVERRVEENIPSQNG